MKKWVLRIGVAFFVWELVNFIIGAGVVTYFAIAHPDQLVEFTQRMTGQ